MTITLEWEKYLELQQYLLTNLDMLYFTSSLVKTGCIDVIFNKEEDATAFKLKFAL